MKSPLEISLEIQKAWREGKDDTKLQREYWIAWRREAASLNPNLSQAEKDRRKIEDESYLVMI